MLAKKVASPQQRRTTPRERRLLLEPLEDHRLLAIDVLLVRDLGAVGAHAQAQELTQVGDITFFTAHTAETGSELWRTNGTREGTVLVKDIDPGRTTYEDYPARGSAPRYLTNVNGTLFFTASRSDLGRELWKSDGTAAGTVLVKDIRPEIDKFTGPRSSYPTSFVNFQGTLLFSAQSERGAELWRSDGTAAGTVIVKDILAGPQGALQIGNFESHHGTELVELNGTLFFSAANYLGSELWKTDGTAAGTKLVKDIYPGLDYEGTSQERAAGSFPRRLININGTLFFTARDSRGFELWKSDGTAAGTTLVKDIATGLDNEGTPRESAASSAPFYLTNVNGTLFFTAFDPRGRELWKSDGSAAGTLLVKDTNSWPASAYGSSYAPSTPRHLTNFKGTLFFTAENDDDGNEVWTSDGTAAGTKMLKNIHLGIYPDYYGHYGDADPDQFTVVGDTIFFAASHLLLGRELWQSNGTAAGTFMVEDIATGSSYGYGHSSDPLSLANINGTLLFAVGGELWRTGENSRPTLSLGGAVTFTQVQAAALLAPAAIVGDGDDTAFGGGKLRVEIADHAAPGDRLQIVHQGKGPGQISVAGNVVAFQGKNIGNFSGGSGATPLVVNLYPAATLTATQALVRSLAFSNIDAAPPLELRRVRFVLDDGDRGLSRPESVYVNVQRSDGRTILQVAGKAVYYEGAVPRRIAPQLLIAAASRPHFGNGQITVAITKNGAATDRLTIRHQGSAAGQIGVAGSQVTYGGQAIGTFSGGVGSAPLVIQLSALATRFATQTLLRSVSYQSLDEAPSTLVRHVRFNLDDGAGRASAVAIPLYVRSINDPPQIVLGGTLGYQLNAPPIALAAAAIVRDVDSHNFAGGLLRVQITAGSHVSNRLIIGGALRVDRWNNVWHGQTRIGERGANSGSGTKDLVVRLDAAVSPAVAHELVRAIRFKTVGGVAGPRTIAFSISDGDGRTSAAVTKTVHVN
jgi:ELWxxDGT repeat protein